MKAISLWAAALAVSITLSGCGGDAAAPAPAVPLPPPVVTPPVTPPVVPPVVEPPVVIPPDPVVPVPPVVVVPPPPRDLMHWLQWNVCEKPRTGLGPAGVKYPDRQGTLNDEKTFLRGWINDAYLWYDEVPATIKPADYATAIDYFNVLKTPQLTASGRARDRYHFTYDSARYDALSTQGVDLGYGVLWSRNAAPNLPRTWLAATVEPGSPAFLAGLRRGDMLLTVDDIDFVNAASVDEVARINAGLFPTRADEAHRFTLRRKDDTFMVNMTSAKVSADPVTNTKVIDTPSGKVGYMTFSSHNAVSELELIEAVTTLKGAAIDDLVLDVRYNGGGLLYIASELAYMLTGPIPTSGKVFEKPIYNNKIGAKAPYAFRSVAWGFLAPRPAAPGRVLPFLNLQRVFLLTTPGTCSASESIINSLRGVDIEVILIGGETCGKPYAFTPMANCGTTYFAIEFKGVNEKGYGDYADGFAPTCKVADDMGKELGDPSERLFKTALGYIAGNACPAQPSHLREQSQPMQLVRPEVMEISVYPPSMRP